MITHYDLFAGIGGNSIALEEVFHDEQIKHIFCEWEAFPTAVLKKHWPEAEYWGDIADLVTYTSSTRLQGGKQHRAYQEGERSQRTTGKHFTVVTGGFPCQPFSQAGRRKGTADDRYKWPEMFAVIRNVKPDWVVAENVRGLVTWNEGMVLEQVCTDLESEGYEVQPIIIPAVAVNAPHRRDRVWIIAHRDSERGGTGYREIQETDGEVPEWHNHAELSNTDRRAITDCSSERRNDRGDNREERYLLHDKDRDAEKSEPERNRRLGGISATNEAITNTRPQRRQSGGSESLQPSRQEPKQPNHEYPDWSRNWQEVAFATCDDTVDDGLPRIMDGATISRAKWRQGSLKAYGNAIVPQVAMQIFRAIKLNQMKGEK